MEEIREDLVLKVAEAVEQTSSSFDLLVITSREGAKLAGIDGLAAKIGNDRIDAVCFALILPTLTPAEKDAVRDLLRP
jgi:hypothetical protein